MNEKLKSRIEELKGYAELDGFTINIDSERDFWSFVMSIPASQKASLVLLDNGNLRAIWKDSAKNHVGIQFLGNGKVQYVIFKRRPGAADVSRVADIETLEGVKAKIRAFDLESLVNA